MHQNLGYLFAAFAATWIALFAYFFFIQRLLADASRRLRWLEDQAKGAGESRPYPGSESGAPPADD